MDIRKRTDPLTLLGAVVSLFLVISNDPWWSIRGANGNNLLTMQVSPFYFHATATGLSTTAPFVEFLGPFTRILLSLVFESLRGRKARLGQKGVGAIFTQDESSQ